MEQKSSWSTLKIGSDLYIGKINQNVDDSSFTFWLSDFKVLWSETIASKVELIKRASNINPTIVIDDNIADQLIRVICKVENAAVDNKNINPNDTELNLQLTYSTEAGVAYTFNWLLEKCEPQHFFDQITKALLQQITELDDHKRQLVDIAKRKDDEIKQYKIEGAPELMRKRFITEEFKEDAFTSHVQMFNCDIREFQSVIGPLPKNVANIEETKEVTVSPVKNTENKKHSSPKGIRHRRNFRELKAIVPRGVVYDEDEDSDPASNNEPTQHNDTTNPAKRTRQSSDC